MPNGQVNYVWIQNPTLELAPRRGFIQAPRPMKIRHCFLATLLTLLALPAQSEVTYWNWTYVIEGDSGLITAEGTSLFEIDGKNQTGPLHSRNHASLRLDLSIDGENVIADLSPNRSIGKTIQLRGLLSFEPRRGRKSCTAVIKVSNGANSVVLQRAEKSCKP